MSCDVHKTLISNLVTWDTVGPVSLYQFSSCTKFSLVINYIHYMYQAIAEAEFIWPILYTTGAQYHWNYPLYINHNKPSVKINYVYLPSQRLSSYILYH